MTKRGAKVKAGDKMLLTKQVDPAMNGVHVGHPVNGHTNGTAAAKVFDTPLGPMTATEIAAAINAGRLGFDGMHATAVSDGEVAVREPARGVATKPPAFATTVPGVPLRVVIRTAEEPERVFVVYAPDSDAAIARFERAMPGRKITSMEFEPGDPPCAAAARGALDGGRGAP